MHGYTYDLGTPSSSQELFTTTTKRIREYVARELRDAGDFGTGLSELSLPHLTEPDPPADMADVVAMERYKMNLKTFIDRQNQRRANTEKVFFIIFGQCAQSVRDRLEADPT